MMECKIINCEDEYKCKDYCSKHYDMFRLHGDPLHKRIPPIINICSIDNCDRRCVGSGYCGKHYDRFKNHGDPLYKKPALICDLEECEEKHYGKGYCKEHYKEHYLQLPEVKARNKIIRVIWNEENKYKIKKQKKEYHKKNLLKFLGYQKKYIAQQGKDLGMTSSQFGFALRVWSESVKKRDNYTCQICKFKDVQIKLNAHHILYKNRHPELALDVNNGVTLCLDCHYYYHKLNGWK